MRRCKEKSFACGSKHLIARLCSSLQRVPGWLLPGKQYQPPHLSLISAFSCGFLPCQELNCSFSALWTTQSCSSWVSLLLIPEETQLFFFFFSFQEWEVIYSTEKFNAGTDCMWGVNFSLTLRKIIGSKTKILNEITIITQFQKGLESISDFYLQFFGTSSLKQVLYHTAGSEKITEETNNVIHIFLRRKKLLWQMELI